MTEAAFHNKITWITFIFGVLVVMIHGNNIELFIEPGTEGGLAAAVSGFEGLISAAAPIVAVTGFFIISAYLFYRNASWDNLFQKMLRRVGSVLVPYIVWTTLYYLFFAFGGQFPALWGLLGREEVAFTLSGLADAIVNYTYNPVLWYLQQLILLIAVSPLVYAVMSKRLAGAGILLLLLFVISRGAIIPVINLDALLYYSFGAYLAIHASGLVERMDGATAKEKAGKIGKALAGVLLSVFLYTAYIRYSSILMTVLFAIAAPVTVWLALPAKLPPAAVYMKYSLFLYAFHFLPVRAINKLGALILPHNAVMAVLVYIGLPVLVIGLNWAIAELLQKKIPPLWKLLSGGR